MRREVLGVVGALMVALVVTAFAQAGAARSTIDRADEQRGPQVHYVYAVPKNGVDRGLDKTGAIAASVDAQQRWFAQESGGAQLRVDTAQGQLDVTYVALPFTISELAETDTPNAIRDYFEQRGISKTGKKYVVYYEGPPEGGASFCGQTDGDSIAVVYLRSDCGGGGLALAGPGQDAQANDFTALHELLHTLGAVPSCAKNYDASGAGQHVRGPANDLMATGRDPTAPRLDPGRDDYFAHGRTGCPDLAMSTYLVGNRVVATLKISSALARVQGTRLTLFAEIKAGSWQKVTGNCRVQIAGFPQTMGGTATFNGNNVGCGWRLSSLFLNAWRQREITFQVHLVLRSEGLVAKRTLVVRAP